MQAVLFSMGEIASIWIKRFKGGPMDPVAEARLVPGRGIVGNRNQGGKRQVTIIDEAAWQDAVHDVGVNVNPAARRANVMLRGIDLEKSRGQFLRLGACVIRIYGETRPCEQMETAQAGLRAALGSHWRGGVFGEILEGGDIRVGDPAGFIDYSIDSTLPSSR